MVMEKPTIPNAPPSTPTPPQPRDRDITTSSNTQKGKLPTAQELISHYESQGLETQEASVKVIEDLQNMLFKVITSGRGKKNRFMAETSRKLDNVQTRLAVVELKLDSKPGYAETLALGVTAGGVLKGIGYALPHVVGTFGQMWNAVTSSTKSSSSS
ncbi:hypothetical protein L1049_004247 [Liquidambar formosana]|uniref:Uncharacterized protein n=1 Tax=Liquidambar formosana TaxID=63359 RepID=A0AAP0WVY7_LIQFO